MYGSNYCVGKLEFFLFFLPFFQPFPLKNDGRRCPPMKSEDSLLTLSLPKHGHRCPPIKSEARDEAEAQTFPPRGSHLDCRFVISVRRGFLSLVIRKISVKFKAVFYLDFTLWKTKVVVNTEDFSSNAVETWNRTSSQRYDVKTLVRHLLLKTIACTIVS